MLTDKQETAMLGLIERVARLEDFARRVSGVLAASGQALYLAKNVAEQVVPILTTPVKVLYDFGHSAEDRIEDE